MLRVIGYLMLVVCGFDLILAFVWVGLVTYNELHIQYKEAFGNGLKMPLKGNKDDKDTKESD